jgi:glutaredoxin 3|tara:strand:+ start:150 stop:323 length:174 start_codon:yes stop_codon:yes gene_type:complete
MAKNLLNEQKIDFIEVSLDHDQDARRMLKSMECRTVPQIFNGELHIGGYTELKQYLD